MRLLCRLIGHRRTFTQKLIQGGYRSWMYCSRCHGRLSDDIEVGTWGMRVRSAP